MMLTDPGKKKIATIILAKMGKPDKVEEADPPVEDNQMALESAMEDLLGAIEAKDAKQMAQILQDFVYLCDEPGAEEE